MPSKVRKPCAKCTNGRGVALCNGCDQIFCISHFTEHRQDLSQSMDNICQEHDFLQTDLCQENVEHLFITRINIWEEESIKKIQTTAQTIRTRIQDIFDKKKDLLKPAIERLTNEILTSRNSDNYIENDLKTWTETLKTLRDTFDDWSFIDIEEDTEPESTIYLMKLSEKQRLSSVMLSEKFIGITDDVIDFDEEFDRSRSNSDVDLSENNLKAICRIRPRFSSRFVYGNNQYSTGKHSFRFSIEKKGDAALFFGIITSSKKYDSSFLNPNNSSVFGWYNFKSFVISGITQNYSEEIHLTNGDELTLILDCDEHKIYLQHHRTKRILHLLIPLQKCPLPWTIMIGLSNLNDSIRIMT